MRKMLLFFKLLQVVLLLLIFCSTAESKKTLQAKTKKTYIIHMDKSTMPESFTDHLDWYDSSLKSVSDSAEMLYTYKHVAHGYSTRLTEQEAEALEKQQGILSVTPEVRYELHTTRTPMFLGLDKTTTNLPSASDQQSQVVIGVLDTGIWPELKSLDDTGLGPVPSSWKGVCETGNNMNSSNCNRLAILKHRIEKSK